MQKIKKFAMQYGVAAVALALPLFASAQLGTAPATAPTQTLSTGNITTTLCNAINWMFYGLIVLSIIFVLLAAFRYLTAAGDPEKVKKASHTILYAAIAIVVALLAKGLPSLVTSVSGLTAGSGTFC